MMVCMTEASVTDWADRLGWTFGDRVRKIRRALNVSESADLITFPGHVAERVAA